MRQYRGIVKNGLAEELSYKEHFLTMGFTFVVYYIVLYFLWKAIYAESNGVINGTSFSSAFVSLILVGSLFQCMNNGIEWNMCFNMINGDIIIKLVRPTDYMLYMLSEKCASALSGMIVFAVPVFVITYFMFPGELYLGWNILLFLCCVVISFCTMFLIEFMVGLLSFCTQSVWGISTIKELIVGFFAGTTVPLTFFPEGLYRLSELLPFKSMYYDPVRILMDRTLGIDGGLKILLFQAIWLVVLFIIARVLFKVMSNRIVVNGG